MFDIYVKNYDDSSGVYTTTETRLYGIPIDDEDMAFTDPKITVEMGKAGSFEFSLHFGHPMYNSLLQMKTIFRIEYDGDTIFRGRVLTIDVGHLTGAKKVHCEGDLAFLLDSQAEGIKEDSRPKTNALTYLQRVINDHNSQMSEGMADKQFILGEVPGQYTEATQDTQKVNPDTDYRYGSSSWQDTQKAVTSLSDSFGGFFRTRYQNGSVYLDWLDSFFNSSENVQTIELGKNLIELTSNQEVNNIFTALIPIGSASGNAIYIEGHRTDIHGNNKRILVPQIVGLFTDEELNSGFHSKRDYENAINDYGIIYRSESFSNADTPEKLWTYAVDWIKNNYSGGINSFSITALDMHMIGESNGKFIVGDRVRVMYPDVNAKVDDPYAIVSKVLTIMSVTYDLYHPEKNQYKIGVPNLILKKDYGEKSRSKSSKSSSNKAATDSLNDSRAKDSEGFKSEQERLNWQFVISAINNSDLYQEYEQKYGDKAAFAIQKMAHLILTELDEDPDTADERAKEVQKIILSGEDGKIEFHPPMSQVPGSNWNEKREVQNRIVSMALDAKYGELTIKEKLDETRPDLKEWLLNPSAQLKTVLSLQAKSDGATVKMSKVNGQTQSTAGTAITTMVMDAFSETLGTTKLKLGTFANDTVEGFIDGTATPALDLDGLQKKFTGSDGTKSTFEFDSVNGTGNVGKKQNGSWQVKLNDTVTYTDEDNHEHTLSGFVSAEDFKIGTINSFKTKLAVIDTLFADQATFNTTTTNKLNAVDAVIENLTVSTVSGVKWIQTANLGATNLAFTNASGTGDLKLPDGMNNQKSVKEAFCDANGSFSNGTFTIRLFRFNGVNYKDVPFDVTATTWFAEQIAAAEARGGSSLSITDIIGVAAYNDAVYVSANNVVRSTFRLTAQHKEMEDGEEVITPLKTVEKPLSVNAQPAIDYANGLVELSGVWGSGGSANGHLTVSNTANSNKYHIYLNHGDESWNGTTVIVPVTYSNVETTNPQAFSNTGKSVSVDISSKLQSKTGSNKVVLESNTGSVPLGNGYVGFSGVEYDATNLVNAAVSGVSVDGTWGSGAITITRNNTTVKTDYIKGDTDISNSSWSGTTVTIPILHSTTPGNEQSFTTTGGTAVLNVSSKLENKTGSNKVTISNTTGTISPGNTYIGLRSVEYDASSVLYAGKASVTLNAHTWESQSGSTLPSSRYVRVTTSGRTKANGDTENLEDRANLSLSVNCSNGIATATLKDGQTSMMQATDTYESGGGRSYNEGWYDAYSMVRIYSYHDTMYIETPPSSPPGDGYVAEPDPYYLVVDPLESESDQYQTVRLVGNGITYASTSVSITPTVVNGDFEGFSTSAPTASGYTPITGPLTAPQIVYAVLKTGNTYTSGGSVEINLPSGGITGLEVDGNIVKLSTTSTKQSVKVTSRLVGPTYDSSSHNYIASAYARIDNVDVGNPTTGGSNTAAYTDGQKSVREIGNYAYVASQTTVGIYVKIPYTYNGNTYYKEIKTTYSGAYNNLPHE